MNYFSPGEVFKSLAKGDLKTHYKKEVTKIFEKNGIDVSKIKNKGGMINFWKDKTGGGKKFHNSLDLVQKSLAKKQNFIFDGKLSIKLLKGYYNHSFWLTADFDTRARRYTKREEISFQKAKKLLERKEKLERERWKKIYGFDYFAQEKMAGLVIDTSKKSVKEIVKFIKNHL